MKKLIAVCLTVIMFFMPCAVPVFANVSAVFYRDNAGKLKVLEKDRSIPLDIESIILKFGSAADASGISDIKLCFFNNGKEILLETDISINENEVNIVPKRYLADGKEHSLKCMSADGTVNFETSFYAESEVLTMLANADFRKELGVSVSYQGGSIDRTSEDGINTLHLSVLKGTVSNSFFDLNASSAAFADEYVAETRIKPVKIEGTGKIKIFDSKTSDGNWRIGGCLNSDGSVTISDKNRKMHRAGTWKNSEWITLAAAYNVAEGSCSFYINGEQVIENLPQSTIRPTVFRIDMANSAGDGNLDFYVDYIRIYKGSAPTDETVQPYMHDSVMDDPVTAKSALKGAEAYTVYADFYFKDGKKSKYSSNAHKPVVLNGKAFVTEEFVRDILKITADDSDFEYSDGNKYMPASKAAQLLSKHYLYDERGFFVLSDEEFPYKDSENFIEMFEPSDVIYRYLQFENLRGEEMLYDLMNLSGGVHPRIIYTEEKTKYMKSAAENDGEWANIKKRAIAAADRYLNDSRFSEDCPDANKQSQATSFQTIIKCLAEGYIFTDNAVYAETAMRYMTTLSKWESLGWQTANLTTGHWAMGMAIGYDTFYNYFSATEEGRSKLESIKNAALRTALADTETAYKGEGGPRWIKLRDNFSGVIGGGVMALLLAMADESEVCGKAAYLLENLIKSNEIAVSLYAPDGGYFEGVSYSEYMLGNLTGGIEALFNCCGTDYGLGSAIGFSNAGSFINYMQSSKYNFNFHDCSAQASETYLPYWFAYRYGATAEAEIHYKKDSVRNAGISALGKYYYTMSCEKFGKPDVSDAPLDKYFLHAGGGSMRNSFYARQPVFAGFHGGRTKLAHDMLDLGEFVFESDGVVWAEDLGGDSYSLPYYFAVEGYRIYRKRPEGENCVVINPKQDADSYYGQALGALAELTDFQSAPKAAYAVLDLKDAYSRDVTAYKRGYYFGDGRNTLTVQDEITLKNSSEIYWFMHTSASIEITDKNTAILSCEGKKLRAEVYCSASDFELCSMAAEPLPSSPKVEGQAENTGVRKLAVHINGAEGNVDIAVKLIPLNGFYEPEPLSFCKIDNWQLPSCENFIRTVIKDAQTDCEGFLGAEIQIPQDTESVRLYTDGIEKKFTVFQKGVRTQISGIDISELSPGVHIAEIETVTERGIEKDRAYFTVYSFGRKTLYENDLSSYDGKQISVGGWYFYKTGSGKNEDGAYTVTSPGNNSAVLTGYRTDNVNNSVKEGMVRVECDVKFSSPLGYFVFECMNGQKNWFMHNVRIFENGKLCNGEAYETDKWYHTVLVINTESKTCSVYVNGKPVLMSRHTDAADSFICSKLQYVSEASGAQISYKNFKVENLLKKDTGITLGAKYAGGTAEIALSVPHGSFEGNKLKLYVCGYDEDKITDIKVFTYDICGDFAARESVEMPQNTKKVKAMLWDDNMTAITKSAQEGAFCN